jgi:hypothetical protein
VPEGPGHHLRGCDGGIRGPYRATFRGAFAGALLDQVTATVVVWRELDWAGTWAWREGRFAHRLDGKRAIGREALDAIAVALRAELVRRGAVELPPKGPDAGDDQADAGVGASALAIPSKADPRRVLAARYEPDDGEVRRCCHDHPEHEADSCELCMADEEAEADE